MIRIGILGAARIAPRGIVTPANALLGAEVVAIAAANLERAQDFAAQHSIPMAFGSYAELIARDDIDLVYVALPPSAHLEWCTAALANGKHVLVEKPFASNAQDAAQMVAAARAAGRHLIEGFHYRFHPLFERALDGVRSGEIGRIRHIEAVFNANLPDTPGELRYIEALGGGALMDLGCYCMHWIRTVAGDEPTVVSASARCATPGVDLDIEAELAFTSGPTATLKCSMQPEDGVAVALPARAWRCRRARARQPGVAAFRRHAVDRIGECHPCRRSSPAATPRSTSSSGTSSKSSRVARNP